MMMNIYEDEQVVVVELDDTCSFAVLMEAIKMRRIVPHWL